jgi:hypothetical protein
MIYKNYEGPRFGTHWLAPSGSSHQAEHTRYTPPIADEFGLAAIGWSRTPGHDDRAVSAVVLP